MTHTHLLPHRLDQTVKTCPAPLRFAAYSFLLLTSVSVAPGKSVLIEYLGK